MSRIELRQLRLVAAIARHGSLTRAAAELCVSQPAASRQLTDLEDSLGLLLFSRTPRAMIATAAGAELLEHGAALLAAADALEQRMQRRACEGGGQLRIAIDKVHRDDWLAAVVPAFRAHHANVELTTLRVPDLLGALLAREIDLAVIGEALPSPGIAYAELQRDEMLVVAPAGHALAARPYVSARDLRWTDMLYCFDFETSYLRRRYLEPQGIELNSFHCIDSIDAILRLVEAGEGVTVLPRRRVDHALASPRLAARAIGPEGMHFGWYAAMATDSPKPYLRDFVELLCREVAGH